MNENRNPEGNSAEIVARYISRRTELRINLKSSYYKEVEGRTTMVPGISVRFKEGVYETKDPEIISMLESHPNFGEGDNGEFIRVPDHVLDPLKERDEQYKDLEKRKKELDEREAAVKAAEARISGNEEGVRVPETGKQTDSVNLDSLKRDALLEIAEKEGLKKEDFPVGTKNAKIVEAIRANRSEGDGGSAF